MKYFESTASIDFFDNQEAITKNLHNNIAELLKSEWRVDQYCQKAKFIFKESIDELSRLEQTTPQMLAVSLTSYFDRTEEFCKKIANLDNEIAKAFEQDINDLIINFLYESLSSQQISELFLWVLHYSDKAMACSVAALKRRNIDVGNYEIANLLAKNNYQVIYDYCSLTGGPITSGLSKPLEYALSFFSEVQLLTLFNNAPFELYQTIGSSGSNNLLVLSLKYLTSENLSKLIKYRNYDFIRHVFSGPITYIRNQGDIFEKCVSIIQLISKLNNFDELLVYLLKLATNNDEAFKEIIFYIKKENGDEKLKTLFSQNNFELFRYAADSYDIDLIKFCLEFIDPKFKLKLIQNIGIWHLSDHFLTLSEHNSTRHMIIKELSTMLESENEDTLLREFEKAGELYQANKHYIINQLSAAWDKDIGLFDYIKRLIKYIELRISTIPIEKLDDIEIMLSRCFLKSIRFIPRNEVLDYYRDDLAKIQDSMLKLDEIEILKLIEETINTLTVLKQITVYQFCAIRFMRTSQFEKEQDLIESLAIKIENIKVFDDPAFQGFTTLWGNTLDIKHGSKLTSQDVVIPGNKYHAHLHHLLNDFMQSYGKLINFENFAVAGIGFLVAKNHSLTGARGKKFIWLPLLVPNQQTSHVKDFEDIYQQNFNCRTYTSRMNNKFIANVRRDIMKAHKVLNNVETTLTKDDIQMVNLFHSEEAIYEYLNTYSGAIEALLERLAEKGYQADYKIYDIVLDICTYWQMCNYCQLRAVGIQNSHESGFLNQLQKTLKESENYKGKNITYPKNGIHMLTRVSALMGYSKTQSPDNKSQEKQASIMHTQGASLGEKIALEHISVEQNRGSIVKKFEELGSIRISEIKPETTEDRPLPYRQQVKYTNSNLLSIKGLQGRKVLALPLRGCERLEQPVKQKNVNNFSFFRSSSANEVIKKADSAYQSLVQQHNLKN